MNNKNGFQTMVWGPAAWLFLHCISLNYDPQRNRKETQTFFELLGYVLPCGACRENYLYTIQTNGLKIDDSVFESRESLAFWLFRLHNYVTRCNRKHVSLYKDTKKDFQRMVAFYENFRAKCSKSLGHKRHKEGCIHPLKKGGVRLRSVIRIKPWSEQNTKGSSLLMCSNL
jgi:hypothetical protein